MPENWYIMDKQRERLLAKIRRLEDELEAERKFRAAFEEWMSGDYEGTITICDSGVDEVMLEQAGLTLGVWHELKAQHIDSNEGEAEHDTN